MPLLRTEAENLSNNQLISGVIDEIIDRDDMFAVLPFVKTEGKAYVYNREKTLGGADWLDPNDPVNESSATFQEVVAKLRILAGDVDVDKFLAQTMSDTNDQMAVQIAKKAKTVAREFHKALATGDSTANPKVFDGLPKLLAAAQAYTATVGGSQNVSSCSNGNALTLTLLDELCDAFPNGADVIGGRRGAGRAGRALLRATYGTDAKKQQHKNKNHPKQTHNGIPVIMNEFLAG